MKTTAQTVTVTFDGVVLYSGSDQVEIERARMMVAAEYRAVRDAKNSARNRRIARARKNAR